MLSVPWVQRSRISRPPISSPSYGGGVSLPFAAALPLDLALPPQQGTTCKYFGFAAHMRGGEGPFLQGRQLHLGDRCDAQWWGLPSWSTGRVRLWRPPHSHHNGKASRVGWCHSAGRGSPSTPAPLTPPHWRSRGAPTAMPLSTESSPAVVHLSSTRRPGLSEGGLCLLHMSLSYLVPPLPHQEGMIAWPELRSPLECRDKVPQYHTGRHIIRPRGPSWVREGYLGLFDRHTGDRPTRDLCHGPLKEVHE